MQEKGRLKAWQNRDRLTRTVKLPSCGWLYGDKLTDGIVTMSAIRGEDEELIAGAGEGAAAIPVLRDKLEQLTDFHGLPYGELLFSDWLALLFHFFAFSYGQEMAFRPSCPSCKQQPPAPIIKTLEELKCLVYDDAEGFNKETTREPFTSPPLPPYDDVINFRLLRVKDQIAAEDFLRKSREVGKRGEVVRTFATAKHIVGINGEEVSFFEALDYVRRGGTGATNLALRQAINEVTPGFDMNMPFVCPLCGFTYNLHLPEDGSFFRDAHARSGRPEGTTLCNDQS